MDITSLFKASVKSVRMRNRALRPKSEEQNNRLFPRTTKEVSKFQSKAKDISCNLAKLGEFLTENRRAYLDIGVQLFHEVQRLNPADRAEFDSTAQIFIKSCSQKIHDLKQESTGLPANQHTQDHRRMVINILELYFKSVCNLYQDMKDQYLKRKMEIDKVTKLDGDAIRKHSAPNSKLQSNVYCLVYPN